MSRIQLHFPIGPIPTLICGHPGVLKFPLPLHGFKFHNLHHPSVSIFIATACALSSIVSNSFQLLCSLMIDKLDKLTDIVNIIKTVLHV